MREEACVIPVLDNDEAVSFNCAKKFAQLNKVMVTFYGGEADRNYRKQRLHRRYDRWIGKTLNRHMEAIMNLTDEANALESKITKNYGRLYGGMFASERSRFNNSNMAAERENTEIISALDEERSEILTYISEINEKIEQAAIDKLADEVLAQIKETSEKLEADRIAEIPRIREMTQQKMTQLEIDSQQQSEKLISEFTVLKAQLSSELALLSDPNHSIDELESSCRQSLQKLRTTDYSIGKEILTSHVQMLNDQHTRISLTIQEMAKIDSEGKTAFKTLSNDYESIVKLTDKEMSLLLMQKESTFAPFSKELGEKSSERDSVMHWCDQDLQKKKQMLDEPLLRFESDLREWLVNSQREEQELRTMLGERARVMETQLEAVESRINANETANTIAFSDLEAEQRKQQEANVSSAKSISDAHLADRESQVQIYEKEIQDVKDKFGMESTAVQESIDGARAELESLSKIESDVIVESSEGVLSFDKATEEEISKLKLRNEQELEDLQQEFEMLLQDQKVSAEKQLFAKREQFVKEKSGLTDRQTEMLGATLENMMEKGTLSDEYCLGLLLSKYETQYAEAIHELEGTEINTSEEREVFVSLGETLEELNATRMDLPKKIEGEKDEIERSWIEEETSENQRHKTQNVTVVSGRGRQQVLQMTRSSIETVRSEYRNECLALKKELDKVASFVLEKPVDDSEQHEAEVCLMQEELKKLKEEFGQLHFIAADYENELRDIFDENRKVESNFREQQSLDASEIEAITRPFLTEMKKLTDELNVVRETSEMALAKKEELFRFQIQHLRRAHFEILRALDEEFEEVKMILGDECGSFQSSVSREYARGENRMNDFERRFGSIRERQKLEWEGVLGYYDERIAVLQHKIEFFKTGIEKGPARVEEADVIERLEVKLRAVMLQLGNMLSDASEYKVMLEDQQKRYKKFFQRPVVIASPMRGLIVNLEMSVLFA
jgi:hypothetical protein